MPNHLSIHYEVADAITLANLIEARNYLLTELENHLEGSVYGAFLHKEDVRKNKKLVKYMTKLIEYYGGE